MPFKNHEAIKAWAAVHAPDMLEEVEKILSMPQPKGKRKRGDLLLLELSFEEGRHFQYISPQKSLSPGDRFPSMLMWVGFNAGRQFEHDNPDAPFNDPSVYETG